MADIDLIPPEYRTRIWLHSRVKRTAVAMFTMVVLAVAAFAVFNFLSKDIMRDISVLQKKQAISTQQRDALTALNETRKNLEQQLALLGGLRSGASAPTMFVAIDRALGEGDIWFQNWEFKRAGSVVQEQAEPASNGYFILMPSSGDDASQTWKIETHMTIRGQGRDHSALSRFVRRLFEQPEIQDVRILNTSLAGNREFVNFNLAVTVSSEGTSG